VSETAGRSTGAPRATGTSTPALRWRNVFPGDERQLGTLRRWLAELLPACPARDDVVTVAVELGTNALKFATGGRGGSFAVEITWSGPVVRVAVIDGGAPTGPRLVEDPAGEHGRGLIMVRALSVRTGVVGDERGRLVWAEVPWSGEGAVVPGWSPPGHEAAICADQEALAERFGGVPTWFGQSTLQWWAAMPGWAGGRLLTAPSAKELAVLLDRVLRPPPGPGQMAAGEPAKARASERASAPAAPASLIRRARPYVLRLGTQPC